MENIFFYIYFYVDNIIIFSWIYRSLCRICKIIISFTKTCFYFNQFPFRIYSAGLTRHILELYKTLNVIQLHFLLCNFSAVILISVCVLASGKEKTNIQFKRVLKNKYTQPIVIQSRSVIQGIESVLAVGYVWWMCAQVSKGSILRHQSGSKTKAPKHT